MSRLLAALLLLAALATACDPDDLPTPRESSVDVDTPQLHFELRKGTKAIDPLKVLTK